MSENIMTADLPSITLTLKETGAAVTAQQAYDAYMSGPVLIVAPNGIHYSVVIMNWQDANGEQIDSSNVQGVGFGVTDGVKMGSIIVGSLSIEPN